MNVASENSENLSRSPGSMYRRRHLLYIATLLPYALVSDSEQRQSPRTPVVLPPTKSRNIPEQTSVFEDLNEFNQLIEGLTESVNGGGQMPFKRGVVKMRNLDGTVTDFITNPFFLHDVPIGDQRETLYGYVTVTEDKKYQVGLTKLGEGQWFEGSDQMYYASLGVPVVTPGMALDQKGEVMHDLNKGGDSREGVLLPLQIGMLHYESPQPVRG